MRIVCTTQDSSEWFTARVGTVTASCIDDAMKFVSRGSKVRGDKRIESSAARKAYISELAWGMITRTPIEHYVSRAMDLGKQYEKMARAEYGFRFAPDEEIQQTGFVLHPTLDCLGASPDGLLPEGGVELKVPQFRQHKTLLETGAIPDAWLMQCYCNMLCCEREWWDFASYCPKDDQFGYEAVALPEQFRIFRKRFHRDDDMFRRMEEGSTKTWEEAVLLAQRLMEQYPAGGPSRSKVNAELRQSLDYDASKPFVEQDYDFLDANRLNEAI